MKDYVFIIGESGAINAIDADEIFCIEAPTVEEAYHLLTGGDDAVAPALTKKSIRRYMSRERFASNFASNPPTGTVKRRLFERTPRLKAKGAPTTP